MLFRESTFHISEMPARTFLRLSFLAFLMAAASSADGVPPLPSAGGALRFLRAPFFKDLMEEEPVAAAPAGVAPGVDDDNATPAADFGAVGVVAKGVAVVVVAETVAAENAVLATVELTAAAVAVASPLLAADVTAAGGAVVAAAAGAAAGAASPPFPLSVESIFLFFQNSVGRKWAL